jgi:hypothetical protein
MTEKYREWLACQKLGILPPGVRENWQDNDVWTQACLLAYIQIRKREV